MRKKPEKVKEELDLHREIVENIAAGVFLVRTGDGIIVYANPAMEQIFGYSPGEMIGKHISTVNAPTDKSPEEVAQEITQSLRADGVWRGEVKNIKKDGAVFWSQAEVSTFEHPQHGEVWAATHQDITDRIRVEGALQESEERFHSLFKNATIGLYRTSQDGKILLANPALIAMLGYSTFEELATRNLEEEGYELGYERSNFRQQIEKAGEIKGFESAWTRKDGSTIFVRESARVIRDNTGNILYYEGTVEDITEYIQADAKLRESEQRYRRMFNNHHAVMLLLNPDTGQIVDANPAACAFYGYSLPEITASYITDINILSQEQVVQVLQKVKSEERRHLFFKHRLKSGEIRDVEVFSGPIEIAGQNLLYSIIHDITDRRQAEEALRESERKFKNIADNIPGMVYQFHVRNDGSTDFSYASPRATELFGLPADLSSPDWDLGGRVHPDDRESFLASVTQAIENLTNWNYEGRLVMPTGEVKWFRGISSPTQIGDILVFDGIMLDITERKRVEDALKREEAFRKSVIQRAAEGICVCHAVPEFPHMEFTIWNEQMTQITGYNMEEINRHGWYQSMYPDPEYQQKAVTRMDEMRTGKDLMAEEWIITRVDGEKRTVTISTSVIQGDDNIVHVLAVMADITERKQAEEALQEANKILQAQLDQINLLHETLRKQAIRDSLTGLYNRRYLDEIIEREFSRAKRKVYPISMMIVDIDNFKEFNDTYGHDFGDEVLIAFGALLCDNVRVSDIACRYGGDEFVVVMPDAGTKDAECRAEMLRESFSSMSFSKDGVEISATVSIGISIYPQHGDNSDDIFHCADSALYHAKQAGRNSVHTWKDGQAKPPVSG